jgi:hypothetical protein
VISTFLVFLRGGDREFRNNERQDDPVAVITEC